MAIQNSLSVFSTEIRLLDGYYSLTDLHKASDGKQTKFRPGYFLDKRQTKELVVEIENAGISAIKTVNGRNGGTYACKELVYAYAMWISPKFHLAVIRAFDDLQNQKLLQNRTDTHSEALERAIDKEAQKRSLKHYQRLKDQIREFALKFGKDESDQLRLVAQADIPDSSIVYLHRNDLWALTAAVDTSTVSLDKALRRVKEIEQRTGQSWRPSRSEEDL